MRDDTTTECSLCDDERSIPCRRCDGDDPECTECDGAGLDECPACAGNVSDEPLPDCDRDDIEQGYDPYAGGWSEDA